VQVPSELVAAVDKQQRLSATCKSNVKAAKSALN